MSSNNISWKSNRRKRISVWRLKYGIQNWNCGRVREYINCTLDVMKCFDYVIWTIWRVQNNSSMLLESSCWEEENRKDEIDLLRGNFRFPRSRQSRSREMQVLSRQINWVWEILHFRALLSSSMDLFFMLFSSSMPKMRSQI